MRRSLYKALDRVGRHNELQAFDKRLKFIEIKN